MEENLFIRVPAGATISSVKPDYALIFGYATDRVYAPR